MRKIKKQTKKFGVIKRFFAVLLVVFAIGVGFFMTPTGKVFLTNTYKIWKNISESHDFKLDQVIVEGHARTPLEAINQRLNLVQGMPVFEIDLKTLRKELLMLPWVSQAVIERHLPNMVYIRIHEKKPIALWQNKRRYLPLDETGRPIADETAIFNQMILVVGLDAPSQTPDLIKELEKYPSVYNKVRSAVRVGNRRWNLILNDPEDGLVVYLPDTDIGDALTRLDRLNKEENLLEKDLKIIDLRLKDRLIIRTNAQELAKRERLKGKDL